MGLTTPLIDGLDESDAESEPGLVEEYSRPPTSSVAYFKLAELYGAKSDFETTLLSAFSEVGIHTLIL